MSKLKIIIVACAMQEEYRQAYKAIVGRDYEGNFGEEFEFVGDKGFSFNLIGVGKVQAAMNLTRVLTLMKERNYYNVTHVVNVGFAAGTKDMFLGQVLTVHKVFQYDLRLPSEFSEELKHNQVQDAWMPFASAFNSYCASGDSFVTKEDVEKLITLNPSITCFDMESAAVVRVCQKFKVRPVVIKIISDIPQNEDKSGAKAFMEMYNSDNQKYFNHLKEVIKLL